MGIAILSLSGLFQGLQALHRLGMASDLVQPARALTQAHPRRAAAEPQLAGRRAVRSVCTPRPATLRVLRVCEVQPAAGDIGRMRISGRMADVCAELERLAAREAARRH